MKEKYYIAYGIDICQEQMKRKCPDAELIGKAMLKDYALQFKGAASVVPQKDMQVPVLIWKISEADEIRLDICKGIYEGIYQKETCSIELDDRIIFGITYTNHSSQVSLPKISYIQKMIHGYEQNGMDANYIHEAVLKTLHTETDFPNEERVSEILYKEFIIRLIPEILIRCGENGIANACEGFLIEILDSKKQFLPLEIISAAKGYELSENSEKEAADFAEEYIDEMEEEYLKLLKEITNK
ncbi:MAG: gamma-glutamylcyclotransferase [Oscillospiraceae bacterium]|nr:gamma-glutamylcyclotransferase [Oscillospiraceae bacterium]